MLSGPGGATLGALLTPATPASSQLPCPRTGSRSLKGRMWPGDTINPQSSHVGGKRQTGNGFWASGMELPPGLYHQYHHLTPINLDPTVASPRRAGQTTLLFYFYFLKYSFLYLAVPDLSDSMQDL